MLLTSLLQGTTRNMASPVLAGLVVDFFYTGPSALCSLFPEVFAQEVPKPTVPCHNSSKKLFFSWHMLMCFL